jgi:hypothetical protein
MIEDDKEYEGESATWWVILIVICSAIAILSWFP